jgi:CubicO group peptidase (beta-lactamase class C family)
LRAAAAPRLGGALALLLAAAAAAQEAAPPAAPRDVGALLEPIRAEYALPALAGAVLRGERLAALGATGVRRKGSREPVTAGDLWHLGSCTKAMTATLAARLVEAGRLRWDSRVGELIEGRAGEIHADYRGVTLEQLLAHRGGAPGDVTRLPIWSWLWSFHGPTGEARGRFVADVLGRRPKAEPGVRYLYSNAGYTVAASMLEAAAGEPWETLVRRELFEPLGMTSAGLGAPGRAGAEEQPWGHAVEGRSVRPVEPGRAADNPAAIAPAGGVHATLADWARFVALHLAGARGEPTPLLAPESIRKLHTPPAGDYALGWIVAERGWAGGRVLTHRGSNTLWVAEVWIAPKLDLAYLVATNQGGPRAEEAVQRALTELGRHLASF